MRLSIVFRSALALFMVAPAFAAEGEVALDAAALENQDVQNFVAKYDRTPPTDVGSKNLLEAVRAKDVETAIGTIDCPICMRNLNSDTLATLPCGHVLHEQCFSRLPTRHDSSVHLSGRQCPMCRAMVPLRTPRDNPTALKEALAIFESHGWIPENTDENDILDAPRKWFAERIDQFANLALPILAELERAAEEANTRSSNPVSTAAWLAGFGPHCGILNRVFYNREEVVEELFRTLRKDALDGLDCDRGIMFPLTRHFDDCGIISQWMEGLVETSRITLKRCLADDTPFTREAWMNRMKALTKALKTLRQKVDPRKRAPNVDRTFENSLREGAPPLSQD